MSNTRLEMRRFEHNATISSVDLTVLAAERPRLMKRILSDVFSLLEAKKIKPICPIVVYPISGVEKAFRSLQSGKVYGKVVVVPGADDRVMVIPSKVPNNLLRPDATYVIIGGTGGLGRSMARWMVEKGARNIVLVSRSGAATGKVGLLIQELASSGVNTVVRRCDVSDKKEVDHLISEGFIGLPPVKGVIHGAMVLHVSL